MDLFSGTVRRSVFLGLMLGLLGMTLTTPVWAQAKKSDSVVKITAEGTKPDADGKQLVTVTLNIEKGWHLYANPVKNLDLESAQTVISVNAAMPLKDVKIEYPTGRVDKDQAVGDYNVYEDQVVIKAHVQRAPGDTSSLEVTVKFQSCTKKQCLLPATVKLAVK